MSPRPRFFLLLLALLALPAGAARAEVRVVHEADGTVRLTNRAGGARASAVRTVRDPDGALRLILRGGVTCTPQADTGQYDEAFAAAAEKYGLSVPLLKAVAHTESAFDPMAVSKAGAQGLMQLMPATARELGVDDPHDPVQAIEGGAAYLRRLLDRFGVLRLAIAAYNAGPDAVAKAGGIPAFEETQRYVARVLGWYEKALNLDEPRPGST